MYGDIDEMLLGPEAMVTLPLDPALPAGPGADGADDAVRTEGEAWARHAQRSNGFGGAVASGEPLDEHDQDMRELIRQVLALHWD